MTPFQTTNGGDYDVFVTKLNATGTALIYSTYIGGSERDRGFGIAIDGSGNAYVTGLTQSTDFDLSSGAFQTTHGGLYDVFVTKLDLSGATSLPSVVSLQSSFALHPNPNNGQFIIQSEKGGVFELVDITGKVIQAYRMQSTQIQISETLSSGMYFVREKESGATVKLVIE